MPAVRRRAHARLATAAALVLSGALAACSGAGSTTPTVSDAWVRVPMNADGPAGAFMTIANPGSSDDALVGVTSPAAEAVEVHESYMADDGSMGMRPVAELRIPAKGSVELKSGSYHLMLMGLTGPLTTGSTVAFTLTFKSGASIAVTAEVRAS